MLWFRRKKKQQEEQAPPQAAAPEPRQETPAEGAEGSKPRRRRGSRGGRGRRKAGAGEAQGQQETKDAKPKAEAKPERKQTDRRSAERKTTSQRRERAQSRRRVAPRRAALPAAKRELLVSVDVGEQRVAVLEDGVVAEVYLERPEKRSIAGNVYLGVVDNVLPGMEAAFVEIGLEKNGFLYVDEIVVPELEGKRHGKKIQDLIARGEKILVQAVKDPMKTKGARLTTEISLPGRFVVFVPQGEGLGVSRRLPDEERTRLKEIIKNLDVEQGGVIVRTAAEGASAEDIERDLVFLQRLWKSIEARAKQVKAPALVYQEAELPLRVVRDLFTGDFQRAVIDHDRTHKRVVGYLKKTSPHMVERVERYREKERLFEAWGVDAEIRSTLSRRVDLPSGGYLIFDYAEAFTVVDVNTGRFVGSRSKSSGARLEDTITKNNLEAVKEVVRQLRLRDIGGIIVIDFIDMANPKNRAAVEEALRTELERDRTKTYVVEISPLGLVEMTRQNVTDGPREILTKKCPTCSGDGVVLSETSAAVDAERKLRALVTPGSRVQAYVVEVHPRVASLLVGPGGTRLAAIEEATRRRFFLQPAPHGHGLDHFDVKAEGKLADLQPAAPVEEGQELELKLVEVGLHDPSAGVGKVDGYDVCVADAAKLVGKKVKVRVGRVLHGTAYALRTDAPEESTPLTAESEAEKPTRQPPARKGKAKPAAPADAEAAAEEAEGEEPEVAAAPDAEAPAKKKTRRGSRGGRRRKKKPAEGEATAEAQDGGDAPEPGEAEGPAEPQAEAEAPPKPKRPRTPRIHVPADDGAAPPVEAEAAPEPAVEETAEAPEDEEPKPKKKTRRGSRGGRRRKKPAAAAAGSDNGGAPEADGEPEPDAVAEPEPQALAEPEPEREEDAARDSDWEYTPMSEWGDLR